MSRGDKTGGANLSQLHDFPQTVNDLVRHVGLYDRLDFLHRCVLIVC